MIKFCDRLRYLRTKRGLSQQDLAVQIGLSKSSVNMYERGDREPGLITLEKIADYFNVDLDYLLGKSDYESKHEWLNTLSDANDQLSREASHTESLSDVKQLLIDEIMSADDADIADLIAYLRVKKGITPSGEKP